MLEKAIFRGQKRHKPNVYAVRNIGYSYSEENFKCTRPDLIRLGRKYKNDPSIPEVVAYRIGVEQFKTTIKELRGFFRRINYFEIDQLWLFQIVVKMVLRGYSILV